MSRLVRWTVTTICLLASLALLSDGCTFVLMDEDSTNQRGCYTKIELLMGVGSPTGWVRMAESLSGFVILAAIIVMAWRRFAKNSRRLQVPE